MYWFRLGLAPLLAVLFLACLVLAQSTETPSGVPVAPGPRPPQDVPRNAAVAPPLEEVRDPTEASPRLKEAMGKGKLPGTAPASRLPPIILKGRVLTKDRPPIAMLEVDGKMYIVGQGSTLLGPGNLILRISELTRTEVRIEVGPAKEIITVR